MNKKCISTHKDVAEKSGLDSNSIIKAIVQFLQIFMTETLAKRLVSMALIAAGISERPHYRSNRTVPAQHLDAKKNMDSGNIDDLFLAEHGSGRTGKVKGFEDAIVEELEKNNYHTRRQIADMLLEKFGIKKVCFRSREVSKKKHQAVKKRLDTRKS
jgi:hypothetical protein